VARGSGEPFGTLVLAVAVTTIEVALIVALMFAGGQSANTLARDTVFSALMIACNGVVGLCLVVGGLRHGVLAYRVEGTSPALASLAALAGLALVLPNFTTTTGGAHLQQRAAGVCGCHGVGAVRRVCVCANRAPPGLLFARGQPRREQPCRVATELGGLDQPGVFAAVFGGCGGVGQGLGAPPWARRWRRRDCRTRWWGW